MAIEYRYADGRADRFAAIASEFVAMKVDVIVTWGTATVLATKRATSDIPINARTANALGLKLPPSILLRADEIID